MSHFSGRPAIYSDLRTSESSCVASTPTLRCGGKTSDLGSLATFFGLVAAGVAVALQSLILSVVGYFILVGRRGIRVGDRVQISGATGDVTDIGWLRFEVKEMDTRTQQPTGNVVTFSKLFVLASPGTGLSKLNRDVLKGAVGNRREGVALDYARPLRSLHSRHSEIAGPFTSFTDLLRSRMRMLTEQEVENVNSEGAAPGSNE